MIAGEPAGTLLESARFRRSLVASGVGHLLLAAFLAFAPLVHRRAVTPTPVYVDIVSPPRPRPAPAMKVQPAAAKPRVRQRVEQPVVLKPKPAAKPKPAEPATPAEPEPASKVADAPSAADLLARLREQVGPETEVADQAERGGGGRFDPVLAAYHRRVTGLLQSNWAGVAAFRGQQSLAAHFEVELDAMGGMVSLSKTRSSGNRFFDESAERAIRRSVPFPSPPRGAITLDVIFEPKGVF